MPYATRQELIAQVGQDLVFVLAGTVTGGTALNEARIDEVLRRVSAEIDGYLSVRYQLPIATPPDLLIGLAIDMAVYRLPTDAAAATDEQRRRFDDAVAFLTKVAAGKANLPIKATGGGHSHPKPRPVAIISGKRLFTRKQTEGIR